MKNIIFILGGVRSGKSNYGLALGNQLAEQHQLQKIFIATAQADDTTMQARIAKHQQTRDADWQLAEIPLAVSDYLKQSQSNQLLLIDCISIWLNNSLYHQYDKKDSLEQLGNAIKNCPAHLIFIGQEIGLAPHHENHIVRQFVDDNGEMNQKLAKMANKVYFVSAGLPVTLKG